MYNDENLLYIYHSAQTHLQDCLDEMIFGDIYSLGDDFNEVANARYHNAVVQRREVGDAWFFAWDAMEAK